MTMFPAVTPGATANPADEPPAYTTLTGIANSNYKPDEQVSYIRNHNKAAV